MSYLSEFHDNRRALVASALGMATGYTINNYVNNLFLPSLIDEFAWDPSNVALVGLAAILSMLFQPIAGRLADRYGVRLVALVGVLVAPCIYVAMSRMTGSLVAFGALTVLQIAIVAATTGVAVYSRLVATSFAKARGAALALMACAPSVSGAIAAPFLAQRIEAEGWRSAYVTTAIVVLVLGLVAIALVPRQEPKKPSTGQTAATMNSRGTIRDLWRHPAFRIVMVGMALCSLSISMQISQLKLIVTGFGLDPAAAASLISIYAVGVIVGRLVCGMALDHLPTAIVSFFVLILPCVGLCILAAEATSLIALSIAVLSLGFSLGAEGDVAGYICMKYFDLDVYSTAMGFVVGSISVSSAAGALILSASLKLFSSYSPFMIVCAVCALIGGSLFLLLLRLQDAEHLSGSHVRS